MSGEARNNVTNLELVRKDDEDLAAMGRGETDGSPIADLALRWRRDIDTEPYAPAGKRLPGHRAP